MGLSFNVFPRHESPGFVIYRAATQMKAGLQRAFDANGFNVTPEQWAVLSSLWEREGMHQSLLAGKTAKDRHNITRILNLLEKADLVRREPDREDRRLQRVYLTKKGKALKSQLVPVVIEFLRNALAGLTQEDLNAMRRILGTIVANLARTSGDAEVFTSKRNKHPRGEHANR